jgi:hypothetical protein
MLYYQIFSLQQILHLKVFDKNVFLCFKLPFLTANRSTEEILNGYFKNKNILTINCILELCDFLGLIRIE